MKKFALSAVFSLPLLFLGAQITSAEPVDVAGDLIFVVNNVETPEHGAEISVVGLDGIPNTCLADSDAGSFVPLIAGTVATDIVIKGSSAIVTTVNESGLNATVIVDAANCIVTEEIPAPVDPLACVTTVDLDAGLLIIPCVDLGPEEGIATVHMKQRGNSSNWEVSFVGANPDFGGDEEIEEVEEDEEVDEES